MTIWLTNLKYSSEIMTKTNRHVGELKAVEMRLLSINNWTRNHKIWN